VRAGNRQIDRTAAGSPKHSLISNTHREIKWNKESEGSGEMWHCFNRKPIKLGKNWSNIVLKENKCTGHKIMKKWKRNWQRVYGSTICHRPYTQLVQVATLVPSRTLSQKYVIFYREKYVLNLISLLQFCIIRIILFYLSLLSGIKSFK